MLDLFIGRRIVRARTTRRLSRKALASWLNLPIERLQAFETGQRRVPPVILLDIAILLQKRISFFFQTAELPWPAAVTPIAASAIPKRDTWYLPSDGATGRPGPRSGRR